MLKHSPGPAATQVAMAGQCTSSGRLDCTSLRLLIIAATTVLVAGQAAAQLGSSAQCPFSPDAINPSLDKFKALVDRCTGLHGVKMGVPWDCQQFVVCCSGAPLTFSCHAPWESDSYEYIVSSVFDPFLLERGVKGWRREVRGIDPHYC